MHEVMTPLEAAKHLGVTRTYIYQLCRQEDLAAHRDQGFLFVTRESVESYRARPAQSRQEVNARVQEAARERVQDRIRALYASHHPTT